MAADISTKNYTALDLNIFFKNSRDESSKRSGFSDFVPRPKRPEAWKGENNNN